MPRWLCASQTRCSEKFAFAEFRTIEECNAGMKLNSIIYHTHPLQVATTATPCRAPVAHAAQC